MYALTETGVLDTAKFRNAISATREALAFFNNAPAVRFTFAVLVSRPIDGKAIAVITSSHATLTGRFEIAAMGESQPQGRANA
jgi:hypothetical protein